MEPKLASLLWWSTYADENKEDMTMETKKRRHKSPFREKLEDLGIHLYPDKEIAEKCGRTYAESSPEPSGEM